MKLSFFNKALSEEKIAHIKDQAITAFNDEQYDNALEILKPLLKAQSKQESAARCLIEIVDDSYLYIEDGLEVLYEVFESYKDNVPLVSLIGSALEAVRDIDELNSEHPEESIFSDVIKVLQTSLGSVDDEHKEAVLFGLATATRMMSRQYDSLSESCYKELVELSPQSASSYYGLGLFCKTRGLFREGMEANQKGLELLEEPLESYLWNLGICATGANEGKIALDVWKGIGNKIEMGLMDLPQGGYPSCKVKLAEFPLSERTANNDYPGTQETIWIERLSPCHGIIRSVLYYELGVNYGDVILIDGAPITYHTYNDTQIPVFPHLATLQKNNYLFFDFAAVQEEQGQISNISEDLPSDSVVYVHTENVKILCNTCWQDPQENHEDHNNEKKNILRGRIAASPDASPVELLSNIDAALTSLSNCQIYTPELCKAAGLEERASIEQQRFNLLVENT